MNVRRASGEGDKVSLSPPSRSREDANVAYSAKLEEQQATARGTESFLSAPPAGPVRPLSPDALSILSTEEFEQIRLIRRPSRTSQADHGLPKDQSLRARFRASWFRNKGIFLMVLAQFFGVLMNVTTRILEVEGNHGNGLHPFQILFARMGITALLAMAYMHYAKTPHFPLGAPEVRWLLVARGFFGFFGMLSTDTCPTWLDADYSRYECRRLWHVLLAALPAFGRCGRDYLSCSWTFLLGLLQVDQ